MPLFLTSESGSKPPKISIDVGWSKKGKKKVVCSDPPMLLMFKHLRTLHGKETFQHRRAVLRKGCF